MWNPTKHIEQPRIILDLSLWKISSQFQTNVTIRDFLFYINKIITLQDLKCISNNYIFVNMKQIAKVSEYNYIQTNAPLPTSTGSKSFACSQGRKGINNKLI